MASLLSSIPPSTACSAASSCGGWRPKSSVGGGTSLIPARPRSSTTATASSPPLQVEHRFDDAVTTLSEAADMHDLPDVGTALRRPTLDVAGATARGPVDELVDGMWISALGRVEPLGRTCGRTTTSVTSPQISGPQGWELVVDDKFIGVSGRVASSGVLCFALAPRRLTAG